MDEKKNLNIEFISKENVSTTLSHLQKSLMMYFPEDRKKWKAVAILSSKLSTLGGQLSTYDFIHLKDKVYDFVDSKERLHYLRDSVALSDDAANLISITQQLNIDDRIELSSILKEFFEDINTLKKEIGRTYEDINQLLSMVAEYEGKDSVKQFNVITEDISGDYSYDLDKIESLISGHLYDSIFLVADYEIDNHGLDVSRKKTSINDKFSSRITGIDNDEYQEKLDTLVKSIKNLKESMDFIWGKVLSSSDEIVKNSIDNLAKNLLDYRFAVYDILNDKDILPIFVVQAEKIRENKSRGKVIATGDSLRKSAVDAILELREKVDKEDFSKIEQYFKLEIEEIKKEKSKNLQKSGNDCGIG